MALLRDLLRETTRSKTEKKPPVPISRAVQNADRRQSDRGTPLHSYRCPACGEQVNADDPREIQRHHRHVLDSFRIFPTSSRAELAGLRRKPQTDADAETRPRPRPT